MGTAYLLRHGETDYHAKRRVLGRIDAGLNQRGHEQAARVKDFFADMSLAAVYCSPLRRCMETARPVAEEKGVEVQIMQGLMEVDMGEWDGRLIAELFAEDSDRVGKWMANPSSVSLPGGEDFAAVRSRVLAAMREISSRHPGDDRVLVVSHGGPIRGILCEALKMDLDDMFRVQIDLASISTVKFFDGSIPETALVTLVNDTYHLR